MRAGQSTGYLLVTDPAGGDRERDTLTCCHCQRQIVITPDKGAESMRLDRCGQCHRTICPACAAELVRTLKCAPWEARLEALERRAALLRNL